MKKFQNQQPSIHDAIDTGLVDQLKIKPSTYRIPSGKQITGHVIGHERNRRTVEIKIDDGFVDMFQVHYDNPRMEFDVHFIINEIPFMMQHNALKWFRNHQLFDLLIDNSFFGMQNEEIKQKCTKKDGLNDEQNLAITNMISTNITVPFLLFGPPGN